MSLEQLIETMKDEIDNAGVEVGKFSGGNQSAGTRVRKHMQTIKGVAQNIRSEVQYIKNS